MKTPNFSKYIKSSFKLTKKYKWLWIFGALVGGGGSTSSNSGYDFAKNLNIKDQDPTKLFKGVPEKTANVLGSFTSVFEDWLGQIPVSKWVLFSFLILVTIVSIIILLLIVTNWAKGSLIKGIKIAETGGEVSLNRCSKEGFHYLKKLILLGILLSFIALGLTVLLPFIWTIIYLLFQNIAFLKVLWIIVGIITIIAAFVALLFLTAFANVYAERLIVLQDMNVIEAFKKGVAMARKAVLATVLTGAVNLGIRIAVGVASFILIAISVGVPTFASVTSYKGNPIFSLFLGIFSAVALVVIMFLSTLLNASLNVFSYSNWNQLFEDVQKIEGGNKND